MRIRTLQDFAYLIRFGLSAVPFTFLLHGVTSQLRQKWMETRLADAEGNLLDRPRSFLATLVTTLFPSHPHPSPLRGLGEVRTWSELPGGLEVTCKGGALRLEILASDLLRIRHADSGSFDLPRSAAVLSKDWAALPVRLLEDKESLILLSDRLECRLEKGTGRLTVFCGGQPILEESKALTWQGRATSLSMHLPTTVQVFGLGEKAWGMNRRGRRWVCWNHDPMTFDEGDDPLYASIPFWLTLDRDQAHGLFLDNAGRTWFDFGATDPETCSIGAEVGELRLYLFAGPTLDAVLERYTELTGHMPLPPLWSLGYHQSRWSYESADEVRRIALELRARKIPCDAIHLDIDYMDEWRCFTWDTKRFPNPRGLLSELKAEGFRAVPVVDPGIKVDPNYWVDRQGIEEGMFCRLPNGTFYQKPAWPSYAHFPDFTNPRVRDWWGSLYREMLQVGVAGVENDMNEPADLGGGDPPPFLEHDNDGEPTDQRACHNLYGLQMARATYEGLQKLQPENRPFVITRSTFAGGQRYGATWTADNQSTFAHLQLSLAMCLSLGLSGFSFAGCDVGGFARACNGELLARWIQLGAFLPFFRNHCAKSSPPQEPWVFGGEVESACRQAIELRYQLIPYLYSAFEQCSRNGRPIIRPLWWDWPHDARACKRDSEFLYGDNLLVAPILEEGARSREVYLPPGEWFQWKSGARLEGGQTCTVQTPLDAIALFARAGAVVPGWPVRQFVGETLPNELIFQVFPGNARSFLYEDDGCSLAYQQGFFRRTCILQSHGKDLLSFDFQREGAYDPPSQFWHFQVWGLHDLPCQVLADGQPIAQPTFADRCLSFATKPASRIDLRW